MSTISSAYSEECREPTVELEHPVVEMHLSRCFTRSAPGSSGNQAWPIDCELALIP